MEILLTIGAIIACVLLFSFAIFIHEFGHYLVARVLGLKVDAFSIGFGPALWKRKIGGVEYRVSAIPFGGYVALPQLDPEGTKGVQGTKDAPDAPVLPEIAAWKRIAVAFAGPFGNVVLAVALAFLLAAVPGARFGSVSTEVGHVAAKGPAGQAGLRAGDVITAVGGHAVATWTDVKTEVQLSDGKPLRLDVRRGGADAVLSVTPARDDVTGAWYILAFSTTNNVQAAAWMPHRAPLRQLAWDAGQIVRILKAFVTPKEAKAAAKAVGGPVMIAEGLYHQVRRNGWDALGFLRFLNVNLAMLNLMPIPVLDGGLILFALFELLFRRRPPKKFVDILTQIFMYLLIGLMLFLVFRDVKRSVRIHKAQAAWEEKAATNALEKATAPAPEKTAK